jgi:Ca-activated chloride channel family protein
MIRNITTAPAPAQDSIHMMNSGSHPGLHTRNNMRVPLVGCSAAGRLDGLLFQLTVEQHYRNTSESAIETVYTFPLPLGAVLLAFELDLNGTRHVASAFARQQAERRYENAIDDGNSAALLVHNGNGLFTATVANLKPGETATVRYRYAMLLHAHGNQVRLNLPTVIAPRYGNPADAGLEGPAIPGADLFVEYPFSLRIELPGIQDASRISSPSHQITTTPTADGLAAGIARTGLLDRDFVLTLDHPGALAGTLVAADGDGFVALASAVLPAGEADCRPLSAKILLDCSGSMSGDSIDAARRALLQFLDNLTGADQFSITRFGTHCQHVTQGLERADARSIRQVTQLVQCMPADMGGTNMREAIAATIAIPVSAKSGTDIVLITDGEVYDVDRIVETAAQSGHRLFVVAIGAAPNEALARRVSERTGGACDFLAAGEPVEPAILRMFSRLRAVPRTVRKVDWPVAPDWIAPLPVAVFPNDTVHFMAGFRERPAGNVSVTLAGDGTDSTLTLPIAAQILPGDVLPRLAAAQRLAELPEGVARDLAIQHQLASEFTSLVLVAERTEEDKVQQLPDTIAVPQMLAAGWGGVGEVAAAFHGLEMPVAQRLARAPVHVARCVTQRMDRLLDMDMPAFLCRESEGSEGSAPLDIQEVLRPAAVAPCPPLARELREAIVKAVVDAMSRGEPLPESVAALDRLCALPEWLRQALESECTAVAGTHGTEAEFIRAFIEYLDRDQGLVAMPQVGYFSRRRIRTLRQRVAVRLPLAEASGT